MVNALDIGIIWFIQHFGLFFIISTLLTLFLLDKLMLTKYLKQEWDGFFKDEDSGEKVDILHDRIDKIKIDHRHIFYTETHPEPTSIINVQVDKKTFNMNIAAIAVFIILLVLIPSLYLPCFISALLFVFINPIKGKDGKTKPSISHYFSKVDYKLIYFFVCLFILVHLMELTGLLEFIEELVLLISNENLFVLCIFILIATSVLSGFMDNAPVTIIFLPIISMLIADIGGDISPIIFAFIMGINLGGNFLPQGSACDMMTLEIARRNFVYDLSYKKLFKVGGTFAIIHIMMGIGYLAIMIFALGL
jgi:Na+/H+ antiporter NhaD/arsenite permease-like protein